MRTFLSYTLFFSFFFFFFSILFLMLENNKNVNCFFLFAAKGTAKTKFTFRVKFGKWFSEIFLFRFSFELILLFERTANKIRYLIGDFSRRIYNGCMLRNDEYWLLFFSYNFLWTQETFSLTQKKQKKKIERPLIR